ncbi:hypothetical protein E1180_21520 [Roseibium denhamense]|uniref:Uncharacterized protein n=1 Tax=Roseibium denhamense TaxID=76305 RepID=A0ABY1NR84_9HYPH|nr:hypothetical protein [Roseibium denhamense]MTI08083.1 hypothetical protein [Roseibium denhamense]SMP16135.1 hypothetical protein SAMN06265374_1675 [Roseibium denhamense]
MQRHGPSQFDVTPLPGKTSVSAHGTTDDPVYGVFTGYILLAILFTSAAMIGVVYQDLDHFLSTLQTASVFGIPLPISGVSVLLIAALSALAWLNRPTQIRAGFALSASMLLLALVSLPGLSTSV